ncbi:hypothetical protein BSIN_3991 [Burkholderia singularis]|uniref:Uncharacterized protein n=1 Tax=Burkholderia singularis TaxID=1503053 RepID=A0A238H6N6_9BURK|nr:hypothetical protein BSIN_3991 [Burkholderia singularis]
MRLDEPPARPAPLQTECMQTARSKSLPGTAQPRRAAGLTLPRTRVGKGPHAKMASFELSLRRWRHEYRDFGGRHRQAHAFGAA